MSKTKTQKDWSPKHPDGCDCHRCSNVSRPLYFGEQGREDAVKTPTHTDPFTVEVPAMVLLEEEGFIPEDFAALDRQQMFA